MSEKKDVFERAFATLTTFEKKISTDDQTVNTFIDYYKISNR